MTDHYTAGVAAGLPDPSSDFAEMLRRLAEAAMSVTCHDISDDMPEFIYQVESMERKFRPIVRSYIGKKASKKRRALSPAPAQGCAPAVPEGYRLVPEAALAWLFGEAPDADGDWFGDKPVEKIGRLTPGFWWRAVFRKMIEEGQPPAPQRGEGGP